MPNGQKEPEKGCILVVDDDMDSRKAITGTLGVRDYRYFDSATGDRGIELLKAHNDEIDACIIDQQLGAGMSGVETVRTIREKYPSIPILVFTGRDGDGADVIRAGASLYLQKRFLERANLIVVVEALVTMRRFASEVAITANDLELLQRSFDAMAVEVMILDPEHNVLLINARKREALGLASDMSVTGKCWETVCCCDAPCTACEFSSCKNGGEPREIEVRDRTLIFHTASVNDEDGVTKYYVQTATDVTRRKKIIQIIQQLAQLTAHPTEKIADRVVEELYAMGYSRVRLYLVNEAGQPVGCASRGMDEGFNIRAFNLGDDDPNALEAFREAQPIMLGREELKTDRLFDDFQKEGVAHQLVVPLQSASEVVGMLVIDDKDASRLLGMEDVDLMSLFGTGIADAISTSNTRARREREFQWVEATQDIDSALAENPSLAHVFGSIIRTFVNLMQADSGLVLILDETDGHLTPFALSDGLNQELYGFRHPGDNGLVGKCLKSGEKVVVHDVWKDPKFIDFFTSLHDGTPWKAFIGEKRGAVVVPIRRSATTLMGVLILRFDRDFELHAADDAYVDGIANRIAIALAKYDQEQAVQSMLMHQAKLSDLALLTAGVAHGLKAPLTNIRSSLDVVAGNTLPPQAHQHIAQAHSQLDRAYKMIENLRRWARPQGMEPDFIRVDECLNELIEIVRLEFEDRKITIRERFNGGVPLAFVPPDGFRLAIIDMFWNAYNAMPDGGDLTVSLRRNDGEKSVVLAISDNGTGMKPQQVESLLSFNPFTAPPPGGGGLGLYLANRVLRQVQGRLQCESEPGKGTTFYLTIPTERPVG